MGMTYYAVTDDPNELAHYGILGMKWGVRKESPRHSGSRRPKSAAYKRAQSKLGKMMKSGIKKAEAHWKTYNSPAAKEERFMKKAMQQARTGTLKYGRLTDAQVRRVTDRLALERNARQLGSTENARFGKRIKTAIGEGVVRGVGMGTASYINARFEGRGRSTADLKAQKRREKYEAKSSTQYRKAKTKQKQQYYETAFDEDVHPLDRRYATARERNKLLSEVREKNKLSAVRKQNEETFNRSYYSNMGKNVADWQKSKADKPSNNYKIFNDYEQSKAYPRLASGTSSYAVTRNTYKPPESNTVIYVDKQGVARRKKPGGKKN